jgi:hypothetical protein
MSIATLVFIDDIGAVKLEIAAESPIHQMKWQVEAG